MLHSAGRNWNLFHDHDQSGEPSLFHSQWAETFASGLNSGSFVFGAGTPAPLHTELDSHLFPAFAAQADASTGPTQSDELTFLTGVNATGQIAAVSFDTWNGGNPASYSGPSDAQKWGGSAADTGGGTVKFYFSPGSHWTSDEKSALSSGLKLWSDVANIHFVRTADAGSAQITFVRGSDGSAYETASTSGSARIGSSSIPHMEHATVSIDTSVPGFGPVGGTFARYGGYPWETLIHEEGHAIGLGHAGPYNGDVNARTQQYSSYDMRLWSLMSYIEPSEPAKYASQYPAGTDWGVSKDGYGNDPTTVMMLDILAAQRLYGAPTKTAFSGGQTFGFNCNITDGTEKFFDFNVNKTPVVTLFDTGGQNTIDLSGFSKGSIVDLHAGTFNSCAGLTNNLCIAFDTRINTAIGGTGNDAFTANNSGDHLVGRDGDDKLIGGNGHDVLSGGNGDDRITGGTAQDSLSGAAGNDALASGAGDDKLTGGLGADHLTGGAGADKYVYTAIAESTAKVFDTITGFDPTRGDTFDLNRPVHGIDAKVGSGVLHTATFNADMMAAVGAAKLEAHHAVLFTPTGGDYMGETFLIVDGNGQAGYQAGRDYLFALDHAGHLSGLALTNFT